jgi:predicted transposase YbfD/YdcC
LPKKTFEAAAVVGVHLIVQLKGNQPTLAQNAEDICLATAPQSSTETIDFDKRNRREIRKITVFNAAKAVAETEWEPYVKALIRVERNVYRYNTANGAFTLAHEISHYLSNRPVTAAQAADAVRLHWGIENGFHYVRDVTMREDASRIRVNPGIFARCRSFAYNILRFNQRDTIAQDRYETALGGFDALASLLLCSEN